MALSSYNLPISSFPGSALNSPDVFQQEIAASPTITKAVDHIDVVGATVTVWFKAALDAGEQSALATLAGAHDDTPPASGIPVEVVNQPRVREDGILYSVPKPSSYGLVMCDRDLKVVTCTLGAGAVEDLKIDTGTMLEVSWGELTPTGVFKLVNGAMAECSDQADADTNGVLSIFDYHAKMPNGTPIAYELRDGLLYVDPTLPAGQEFAHRAYAVVAPDVPGAAGGSVAIFDAYLGGNPDGVVAALSPQATVLDPSGPAGTAGSKFRLYVRHPAGSKLTHVLRLVTYRAPGTF